MRRSVTALLLLAFILCWVMPARAYTLQYTDGAARLRIKWPTASIKVALSASLNNPPSNIKPGSDVLGAARRALARWSEAAHVQFVEISSASLSISPNGAGDGVSLITVADTAENRAVFDSADRTGRTRVFYDPATGEITEADIVINPATPFSTDATPSTYDLEATFTHEIGHFLGLEHSSEAGSAMQPRQGINGLYEQAALGSRTLSEDDRAGVRALYDLHEGFGAITGKISSATGTPAGSTHVWAEESETGRVVAGNTSLPDGSYQIEGLPPGSYRLVAESSTANDNQVSVAAGETARLDIALGRGGQNLKPQLFGTNGHLSTVAVPLVRGRRYTIFVGGQGLDQVKADGVSVTSPFIKVNPASLTLQSGVNYEHPIISFDVEVAREAPLGDYSIRLQSRVGEVAYISGGLTVDSADDAANADGSAESPASEEGTLSLVNRFLASFLAG